jgi:hypothetical protein
MVLSVESLYAIGAGDPHISVLVLRDSPNRIADQTFGDVDVLDSKRLCEDGGRENQLQEA